MNDFSTCISNFEAWADIWLKKKYEGNTAVNARQSEIQEELVSFGWRYRFIKTDYADIFLVDGNLKN